MKHLTTLPILTSLLTLTSSSPTHPTPSTSPQTTHSNRVCTNYTISLPITAEIYSPSFPPFTSNYDLTDLLQNTTARTANLTFSTASSPSPFLPTTENKTQTYTISGTFCTPTTHILGREKTVLLATHGLGFSRGYWDPVPPVDSPERYSFVNSAVNEGYSIFFYDRLGVGESQKVSGYENQVSIQIAIAAALGKAIKGGEYTGNLGVPEKLVLVGHSFGSAISSAVVEMEPDLADGLILTGFSYASQNLAGFINAAQFRVANLLNSTKFNYLDSGYVVPVDIYSTVELFFKKPDYELPVVEYAQATAQPLGILEILTAQLPPAMPTSYTGSVLLISGRYDFIFCTSDCDGVLDAPGRAIYANAKTFESISYPGAGHGLNLAANAQGSFDNILSFINANI